MPLAAKGERTITLIEQRRALVRMTSTQHLLPLKPLKSQERRLAEGLRFGGGWGAEGETGK